MSEQTLLTIQDLASRWAMSERTIYNRITRNTDRPFPIRPLRIGRLVRFPLQAVLDFEQAPHQETPTK